MDMTLTFHAKQENIEKMKNVFNYEEYEAVEQEIGRTDDALSAFLLAKEVNPDDSLGLFVVTVRLMSLTILFVNI